MLSALLALGLVELVACGSVTPAGLEADGAGGAGGGDDARDAGAELALGDAAGEQLEARTDVGALEAAAEVGPGDAITNDVYGTVVQQCPVFSVVQDCHKEGLAGGQRFGYCYRCADHGTPVVGCVNGSPGANGNVCVEACSACAN